MKSKSITNEFNQTIVERTTNANRNSVSVATELEFDVSQFPNLFYDSRHANKFIYFKTDGKNKITGWESDVQKRTVRQ